ncbi:MAG: heme o synthase [Candidatus Bathyarchaeia archaeon]|jgi:protoheme IX farnesyltransferase
MRSTGYGSHLLNNLTDYFSMTKPAITSLNVFVGVATMLLAVGLHVVTPTSLVLLGLAGFLSAGGAGALNCFLERRMDSQMNRTRYRPLPSGRASANAAFSLGLILSISGVALAAIFLNPLTASFIGLGVFWYVFVYTLWLKPRTKWNIVIGGAAGSFSALAGWAAVTGSISFVALLVAFLIFLWTPGHFWGLAIANAKEYAKVQVPMLPVVDGVRTSAVYTALSNIALFPFTLGLFALTANQGNIWALVLLGAALIAYNARFLAANLQMIKDPTPTSAWRVFKMSIIYLFVVLLIVVAAHLV